MNERSITLSSVRKGEGYSTTKGYFRQYQLYYLVADERGVIRLPSKLSGICSSSTSMITAARKIVANLLRKFGAGR